MKVWVIKYALGSGGIFAAEVERPHGNELYVYDHSNFHAQYVLGRDCFESYADAVIAAHSKRSHKIASLKKQIAKLEKLEWAPEPPE